MSDPQAGDHDDSPDVCAGCGASGRSTPVAVSSWSAPPLSTSNAGASSLYRDGIATLVAGAPYASALLRRAVTADPSFSLGHVGLAVADAVARRGYAPAPDHSTLTRGERQHAEIIRAIFDGDVAHAVDLRRVHLLEFPGDVLIVWLPRMLSRI